MNASRVVITQETREKLNNPVLTQAKKRELREGLIKDCIRRAIGGVRTKQELIVAAGFSGDGTSNEYARGSVLINSMIKRGIIGHNSTKEFKKTWTVYEDVKVTPSPRQVAEAATRPVLSVVPQEKKELDKVSLLDMAKEFAWRENSDSLRDFINYAQNTIK